jgi:SAM-dependent methyltransferase
MRRSLLELVCCPACGHSLELDHDPAPRSDVLDGNLHCAGCGLNYPIVKGIPHLYLDDERWVSKAREAQGWVDFHKERNIYEQPEDAVDLEIPYYPEEPWISVGRSFDIALQELEFSLTADTVVLDFGAGRGWAAKHFALRGCRAVALDVTPDENVGLGRSWVLMKHANVYFDPVLADGEGSPFIPESFDLVFCAATLHHTSDLSLFMQNIYDVLRPGGRFCAIGEPCIAVHENAQRVLRRDAGSELEHGINEQRPNLLEYWGALSCAGFDGIKFLWPPGYTSSVVELRNCAKDLGAIYPGVSELGWRINLKRWLMYIYCQLRSLTKRRSVNSLPRLEDERERLMRSVLLSVSGEVIILAEKG